MQFRYLLSTKTAQNLSPFLNGKGAIFQKCDTSVIFYDILIAEGFVFLKKNINSTIAEIDMDKKRSKGVTFWGWIFIVFAVIGLLSVINPQQLLELCGVWIVIYSVISSLAYLICGIFILKLNNSARKAAIVLGIISIIVVPFYFKPMAQQMNSDEFYSKSNQAYIEQMKPELRQKALENLEKGKRLQGKFFR
ncbi:MAG: hypothetical protein NTY34_05555 [Candidatus Omnitrophica bacterium]|nr:hypothetical protein [Candidatus Omnitrophota bacterium]